MISGGNVTAPGFSYLDYIDTSTEPEKQGILGQVHWFDVGGFLVPHKLVQVHTACNGDVVAAGNVLYWAGDNVVTNLLSSALSSSVNHYAGIAPQVTASVPESTSTIIYWMWMQIGGRATVTTNGDDDIAIGDLIIASATTAVCDSAASPTFGNFIGVAAAADNDSANTVAVNLAYKG